MYISTEKYAIFQSKYTAEDIYFEMTPQLTALKNHVLSNIYKDEQIVDSLIEDIDLLCLMEEPFHEVIYQFKRNGILFEGTRQLNAPIIPECFEKLKPIVKRIACRE